jgi:DNA helicase-2/ATP-dependent DNA helicase PcrA
MNFGASKGRGFDRVLIHPTDHMLRWLRNDKQALANQTRAKLYVALTRARMSVAVVANLNQEDAPVGFELFAPAF